MANNLETGHAKNVANFGTLISAVNGYGAVYNPSKQSNTLIALNKLAGVAENAMSLVNGALGKSDIATAARVVAFAPLSKLATRILNAIKSSDTTQQIDDAVHSLVQKIHGKRAKPKKTEEEKAALAAEGKVVKEISSSQMGFDDQLDALNKLVQLLAGIPEYAPNEEELKITTLTSYYNTLKAANAAVVEANTQLKNARLSRNETLYTDDSGLVDVAGSVKLYVKSLFGATSPQYKQISGLRFSIVK
jgi:hypothetical protein